MQINYPRASIAVVVIGTASTVKHLRRVVMASVFVFKIQNMHISLYRHQPSILLDFYHTNHVVYEYGTLVMLHTLGIGMHMHSTAIRD